MYYFILILLLFSSINPFVFSDDAPAPPSEDIPKYWVLEDASNEKKIKAELKQKKILSSNDYVMDAFRVGHFDYVKKRLENGADPNILDNEGNTLLYLAANTQNITMFECLLQHGANPDFGCTNGKKLEDVLTNETKLILAKYWPPPKLPMFTKKIQDAARKGDIAFIEHYIRAGGSIRDKDDDGYFAIVYAVEANQLQAVKTLAQLGANMHVKFKGKRLHHIAIEKGYLPLAKYLMKVHGMTPLETTADGFDCFAIALGMGHYEIFKYLTQDPSLILTKVVFDKSCRLALISGTTSTLDYLIKRKKITLSSSLFLKAVTIGNQRTISHFIDVYQQDVNTGFMGMKTPLMVALENENIPLAYFLKSKGARIAANDKAIDAFYEKMKKQKKLKALDYMDNLSNR